MVEQAALKPWKLFENSHEKYPHQPLVISNNQEFTYSQIDQLIQENCRILGELEFLIAGLYVPNSVNFITWLLALNKLHKVVVPLSYQLKGDSLGERVNYADIQLLITDIKGFQEFAKVRDKVNIRQIIVLHDQNEPELMENPAPTLEIKGLGPDTFGICFTGGSTFKPKGVVLSNRAMAGNALAVAEVLNFTSRDRFLVARPLTQAGPIAGDLLMAISAGASIVMMNDLYLPGVFLKTIQDYGATTTLLVRTTLVQLLEYPHLGKFDLSSWKRLIFGGMTIPESVIREAGVKIPGVELYHTYGLSEASTRVTFAAPEQNLKYPGTVGKAIRGCAIHIYREDGMEAGSGEEGEIFVETEYVMDGYYKNPELTAKALTAKGLYTRDRGYVNGDGYYFITGRSDDLIIQGGNNVYPIEIEEVLLQNPLIREAVVLGVEDEKLGQRIVALVRGTGEKPLELPEIYRWLTLNLEERKVPKEIRIVDQIPRNEMGKINRNELKGFFKR